MTRRIKLIVLIGYLSIICVVMLAYRSNRNQKTKKLRAQLAQIESEKARQAATKAEFDRISRLFPQTGDSMDFARNLHMVAEESGLKTHEVSTDTASIKKNARPGNGSGPAELKRLRLQIVCTGTYRAMAEYVRLVQNQRQLHRIIDMKLSSQDDLVKGSLSVELYFLPGLRGA